MKSQAALVLVGVCITVLAGCAKALLTKYAREHVAVVGTPGGVETLTVGDAEPLSLDGVGFEHWKSDADVRVVTVALRSPDTTSVIDLQTSEPVIVVRETQSSPSRV